MSFFLLPQPQFYIQDLEVPAGSRDWLLVNFWINDNF